MSQTLWTIGHSTHSAEEFLALLDSAKIQVVADVRRFPGSRRHPQFNRGALAQTLASQGIDYLPLPELGGRRTPREDSANTAWRNASFRGYADYMETPEFREALDRMLERASVARLAMMCSEAVWWQCHRSLIADYLKADGYQVIHILSPTKHEEHPYTSAARIVDGRLSYTAA